MDAAAFRHLYAYHVAENRKLWEACAALPDEPFTADSGYSHGSIRDQLLHLVTVDDAWFSGLRGDPPPEPPDAGTVADRARIRARWDEVEARMRDYLAGLRDESLGGRPFADGEDAELRLWQVLIHVVNHGTDHRAQVLRQLAGLGVATESQDHVFYAYEVPLP
jgi:uncharacterized damage-inducible protein DinB